MDWMDVARIKDKYAKTGDCDYCCNSGLLLRKYTFAGTNLVRGFPCNVCGQNHGYADYVKSKYANGVAAANHIRDNLYSFPMEKRHARMDNEFVGNNGSIPIKCHKGDNILELKEYKENNEK
jgi:hypothetical protein